MPFGTRQWVVAFANETYVLIDLTWPYRQLSIRSLCEHLIWNNTNNVIRQNTFEHIKPEQNGRHFADDIVEYISQLKCVIGSVIENVISGSGNGLMMNRRHTITEPMMS